MKKILITGGPHSGKTTTVNALREVYPDAVFVPEAAEQVIHRENKKARDNPKYKPVYPVTNFPAFAPLVLEEALKSELKIPGDSKMVFLDRGLIDHIGYSKLNDYEVHVPAIKQHIKAANYALAFFCEPVGKYTKTEIRHEEPEIALQIHNYLLRAYAESGIEVIHLPPVSLKERLEIIRTTVKPYS
jgi:predicted ATPase